MYCCLLNTLTLSIPLYILTYNSIQVPQTCPVIMPKKAFPFLIFLQIWCCIKSLTWSIFFHTWDPSPIFHIISLQCVFLKYLFCINSLQKDFLVLKFHHNSQNKAFDTSFISRNPIPPSCSGKHKVVHLVQCLPLPPIQLLQKNWAIILWIWVNILLGRFITDK